MLRKIHEDILKPESQIRREIGKVCSIDGCNNPITIYQGVGSKSLCRECQIKQREYGGPGRLDRPHTFHRKWVCDDCGTNVLEIPNVAAIKDEKVKMRVARTLIHGDHSIVRKADGGDDSSENIRSLCYVCHAIKTIVNEDYLKSSR